MVDKKITTHRGVIIKAFKETNDTWTLSIFTKDNACYQAGQFISISPYQFPELTDLVNYFAFKKNKKEPVRAYSLSSSPHEANLAITIKPEYYDPQSESYPPLLSPFLASDILVGREINFLGYSGAYVMPKDMSIYDVVIHVVAGSGIVPSFSIIKDELFNRKNINIKHKLLYINKTKDDIIFHDQLNALIKQFPDRFSLTYFLTQESTKDLGEHYRYHRPRHEDIIASHTDLGKALFFTCGPAITKWQKKQAMLNGLSLTPRFMEWILATLKELKINDKHIKREVYG